MVEFLLNIEKRIKELVFVVMEIFVNCVEGWEVIFNYVLVIFMIVKLMLGVL